MAVKDKPRVLTLTEQTAIEAINADIMRLRNKLKAILAEIGLDPDGSYSIAPDGTVGVRE